MPINKLIIDWTSSEYRKLQEISIELIRNDVAINRFLESDRASQLVFKGKKYQVDPDVIKNPKTPIEGPFKLNFCNKEGDYIVKVNPTYSIHLENVELFSEIRLMIYKKNYIIKDYLGDDYHQMGMNFIEKKIAYKSLTLTRSKKLPTVTQFHDQGIDFSTNAGDTNVYHWIARVLPKIKFIKDLPASLPLIFTYKPSLFQLNCLNFFDLSNPILIVNPHEGVHFKSLIVIEGPWAVGNFEQSKWLVDQCIPKLNNHSLTEFRKKIFIYRRAENRRTLLNQGEIKQKLEANGFESYALDDFLFKDCISLFHSASEIVFEHGACGIWLLFANKNAKVIELMPERNHKSSESLSNYYFWLCHFQKLNYNYIVGKNIKLDPWAEYVIDIALLELEIQ
jgi:hypothetical protein